MKSGESMFITRKHITTKEIRTGNSKGSADFFKKETKGKNIIPIHNSAEMVQATPNGSAYMNGLLAFIGKIPDIVTILKISDRYGNGRESRCMAIGTVTADAKKNTGAILKYLFFAKVKEHMDFLEITEPVNTKPLRTKKKSTARTKDSGIICVLPFQNKK